MPIRSGLPQHVVDEVIKSIPIEFRTTGHINQALNSRLRVLVPRTRVTTLTLIEMYTREHKTLREIASKVGLSAAAIGKRLKKAGITSKDGEWVTRICGFCGVDIKLTRSKTRNTIESYCSTDCYHASREHIGYKPWRRGQRLARAIVGQYFKLEVGNIVTHIDGDYRNNNINNLRVYANYNKKHALAIWDGSVSCGVHTV
jgi:hypothetical protein